MITIFDVNLPTPVVVIVGYIIAISIITFFYFGFDKMRSLRPDGRRVREKTLWILSAIGGSPGALLGMHFFRHKTKKPSFQGMMMLILLLQVAVIFLVLNQLV